jgi:gluconolactonase
MMRVSARYTLLWVGALGALGVASCSAGGEGEESPGPIGFGAAGRAGTGAVAAAGTGAGGRGGSSALGGGAGARNEGQGGVANVATAGSGQGGAANSGGGSGGSSAQATGGSGGSGGSSGQPPTQTGRIGSELCPPGPFGSPLPTAQPAQVATPAGGNVANWEGPVWVGGALYFSEISGGQNPPAARINRFTPGTGLESGVIANTGSNGLALNAAGDLIGATHDTGALSLFDLPAGTRSTFGAQQFMGTRLNSPNDVVVRSDGNAYFSDPDFQAPAQRPQAATRVYRVAPDGAITALAEQFSNPNGVTLSLDETRLFVAANNGFFRYELDAAGVASQQVRLGQVNSPDGMGVDCAGNIYVVENGAGVIHVFDPTGEDELGTITGFGSGVTNVAFGGPDMRTLFVTKLGPPALFTVAMPVPGLPY